MTIEETNDLTCSICLDNFQQGEVVKSINECKHKYHENCLRTWYDNDNGGNGDTCPVCRRRFSEPI